MAHELAGLVAARREAGAEHDVVDAQLEQAQQVLTRDARHLVRLVVDQLELLLEQAVDAAALLLLTKLEEVLALADAAAAVHARRVRTALDRAAHRLALRALEEQLHALAPAEPANRTRVTRHQTLRRFGWRQPLCGIGVTSLIPTTSMPAFWMERIAVSRPEPGPFTITSTLRTP